jgi:nucleoside-diphosphate-sugar epimerase
VSGVALVTGASGFVGSHVVDDLVAHGWRVRALVRRTSRLDFLDPRGIDLIHGDVTDPGSLPKAVEGVSLIVHAAGVVAAAREADYDRVNVVGTEALVKAAREHASALERFLLISSLAAGGPSRFDRPRKEDDPDRPVSTYGRSKLRGEEALKRNAGSLPWTVVRPPGVYGPRDRGFFALARIVARGWIPRLGGQVQPLHVVHAKDLTLGIRAAATSPDAVGRKYYLAHPELTDAVGICRAMATGLGRKAHLLRLPRRSLPMLARVAGDLAFLARKPHPFPEDRLRDWMAPAWTCDVSRARTELGYTPAVDLERGMAETMQWYRSVGWL